MEEFSLLLYFFDVCFVAFKKFTENCFKLRYYGRK